MQRLSLAALTVLGIALWTGVGWSGCLDSCKTSNASVTIDPILKCAGFAFQNADTGCGCDIGVRVSNDCSQSVEVCYRSRPCETVESGADAYIWFAQPKESGAHTWPLTVTEPTEHEVEVTANVELVSSGCSVTANIGSRSGSLIPLSALLVLGAGIWRRVTARKGA